MFVTTEQVLTDCVAQALDILGYSLPDPMEPVQPTKNLKFGDYQSNHAFRVARQHKTNPRALAEKVLEAFPKHYGIEKIEVAGPGFLNFYLSDSFLADQLKAQVRHKYGGISQKTDKCMVIDYSSPNVAKRMHIGHMRSTIIGNTIDRLYRACGWKVIADNHIGDWGTQFGRLIVQWNQDANLEQFAQDPIGELERLYVDFSKVNSPEELEAKEEAARLETAKLQAGDPVNRELWARFIEVSLKEFDGVYERLGVQFDEVLGESAYNDQLPQVVSDLLDCGIASKSKGACVIFFPKESQPKILSETTLVIQKQDGAYLYGTTDLATLEHRRSTWNPDRIVYVTDTRQQLHFQQVFSAWRSWCATRTLDVELPELVHTWFGMLKLPEGAMSTRKGNVIRLVDLLDEAVRRARSVVDQKSPDYSEQERSIVAEAVGVGALRYADLSQNPQSDVLFDWNKILSLEGNTAPFLMYGYARARGIQRKAGLKDMSVEQLQIHGLLERNLALKLLQFPSIVEASAYLQRPNLLCDYLYETGNAFNRFYAQNSVLHAETESLKSSRLALVESMLRIMKRGLELLGIPVLERM